MFQPLIFRGAFAPLWVELFQPTYNFYTPLPKHQQIEKENHLNQTSVTLGLYVDFPGYTQYYTLGNQVPVYRFSSKWSLSPLQSSECKLLNQNNDEFVHWLMISIRWSFFRWRNLSHVYIYHICIWSWFLLLAWKKMWTFLCCLLGDVRTKRHLKWSETLLIELTIIQHPPSIIHRPSIINHHHTPWKINMEPSNHQLRKENDLANLHDYVPC